MCDCDLPPEVKGDLVLQLVPEPLPVSAASHDEELDVTLDPESEEPETPVAETPGGAANRRAPCHLM